MVTSNCTYDEDYSYLFSEKGGRNGKLNKRNTNMSVRTGKYSNQSVYSDKRRFRFRSVDTVKKTSSYLNLQRKLDLEEYEYEHNQQVFEMMMEQQYQEEIQRRQRRNEEEEEDDYDYDSV